MPCTSRYCASDLFTSNVVVNAPSTSLITPKKGKARAMSHSRAAAQGGGQGAGTKFDRRTDQGAAAHCALWHCALHCGAMPRRGRAQRGASTGATPACLRHNPGSGGSAAHSPMGKRQSRRFQYAPVCTPAHFSAMKKMGKANCRQRKGADGRWAAAGTWAGSGTHMEWRMRWAAHVVLSTSAVPCGSAALTSPNTMTWWATIRTMEISRATEAGM